MIVDRFAAVPGFDHADSRRPRECVEPAPGRPAHHRPPARCRESLRYLPSFASGDRGGGELNSCAGSGGSSPSAVLAAWWICSDIGSMRIVGRQLLEQQLAEAHDDRELVLEAVHFDGIDVHAACPGGRLSGAARDQMRVNIVAQLDDIERLVELRRWGPNRETPRSPYCTRRRSRTSARAPGRDSARDSAPWKSMPVMPGIITSQRIAS